MFNSAKDATGLVLVTGASTGIGRSTATHLASLGFRVLAGVRKDLDAQIIEGEARKNGHDIIVPSAVTLSPDGKTLTIGLPGLKPVDQLKIKYKLETAAGGEASNEIYYTINAVP